MTTEPSYLQGWIPAEQFREVQQHFAIQSMFGAPIGEVAYRSIMRRSDGAVWCAPLGTRDPWAAEDADEWVSL